MATPTTARTRAAAVLAALLAVLVLHVGCVDVREFAASWRGPIVKEEAVRQGFTETVEVDPLVLDHVDLQGLSATLTTSDGTFKATRLTRVVKFSNDALSSLTFDGTPLRSYLFYASPEGDASGWPAQMMISLFSDDHVELRVFRGNDLFGVFPLHRAPEDE